MLCWHRSLGCLSHIFAHYLINDTIFGENAFELKICFDFLYFFVWKVSYYGISSLTIILLTWRKWWAPNNASRWQMGFNSAFEGLMYVGLRVKYLLFLSNLDQTWIFWTDFRKNLKYKSAWKSVQWDPSYSMSTDRHDEANSYFSKFCERAQELDRRFKFLLLIKFFFFPTLFDQLTL